MEEVSSSGRAAWGVAGGVSAVILKFMGQDLYWLRVLIDTNDTGKIPGMLTMYLILLFCLSVIGAICAMASKENQPVKLLAIAVAAPALVTTWLGGSTSELSRTRTAISDLSFVSTAHASEVSTTTSSDFWRGFLLPLGIGKDEQQYRVVVGSFKDKAAAEALAASLSKRPDLTAKVGDPKPGNDYYSVYVGEYAPYPVAKSLKESVSKNLGTDDVFLAPHRIQ